MIGEGKYLHVSLTHSKIPVEFKMSPSGSNFRQTFGQRMLVASRGGGSLEELNKAAILLCTGACNTTPLSKATHGSFRCTGVFFSLAILHKPEPRGKVLPAAGPTRPSASWCLSNKGEEMFDFSVPFFFF